jgi:hypothetical protein
MTVVVGVVQIAVAILIALLTGRATVLCSAFVIHPVGTVFTTSITPKLHRHRLVASSAAASSSEEQEEQEQDESLSTEQAYKNANDLFASKGWEPIQRDLDQLPVFTCANEQGKPLAYTIETTSTEDGIAFTVPCFYCDVDDAQEELRKARENTGLTNLDLIPFPMGKAFMMWSKDEAIIIPNKRAIVQAGAPPNTNPMGQEVPLFACMDIMRASEEGEGGKKKNVLPLFMDLDDANAAVQQAVELDGGNVDDLEVVSLSLNRAVELLATVPETPAFQFIAPEKSFQYIQRYLTS